MLDRVNHARSATARLSRRIASKVSSRPAPVRAIEAMAALVPVFAIMLSIVIPLFQPGYDLGKNTISELVWGHYGWLQTGVFYLLAFSMAVLIVKLFARSATTIRFKVGVALFFLVVGGLIMVALFPTDLPGEPGTTVGLVHVQATAVLMLAFPAACFVIAPGLRTCFSRKWLTLYTRAAGVMTLALIALIAVLVGGGFGWVGAVERLIMVNGLAWVQVVILHTL